MRQKEEETTGGRSDSTMRLICLRLTDLDDSLDLLHHKHTYDPASNSARRYLGLTRTTLSTLMNRVMLKLHAEGRPPRHPMVAAYPACLAAWLHAPGHR